MISTHKQYTIHISGVTTVFSSSAQIDIEELNQYFETNITKLIQPTTLNGIQRTQNLQRNNDPTTLNSCFLQFMDEVIPLVDKYTSQERKLQGEDCGTSRGCDEHESETEHLPYVFKIPRRDRATVFDKHWKEHYNELVEFKQLFGHCNASRTTRGYDQLGNWLADQRKKLRRGKLTREQYDMLTELGRSNGTLSKC